MPDAVSRLRRVDELDTNDEQNVPTDDVCDKGFSVGNNATVPLRATMSSLVALARTQSAADNAAYPDFNRFFVNNPVSVLVSVAMAQQRDLATLDAVNG